MLSICGCHRCTYGADRIKKPLVIGKSVEYKGRWYLAEHFVEEVNGSKARLMKGMRGILDSYDRKEAV